MMSLDDVCANSPDFYEVYMEEDGKLVAMAGTIDTGVEKFQQLQEVSRKSKSPCFCYSFAWDRPSSRK